MEMKWVLVSLAAWDPLLLVYSWVGERKTERGERGGKRDEARQARKENEWIKKKPRS
jgi:hypothetical protein